MRKLGTPGRYARCAAHALRRKTPREGGGYLSAWLGLLRSIICSILIHLLWLREIDGAPLFRSKVKRLYRTFPEPDGRCTQIYKQPAMPPFIRQRVDILYLRGVKACGNAPCATIYYPGGAAAWPSLTQ